MKRWLVSEESYQQAKKRLEDKGYSDKKIMKYLKIGIIIFFLYPAIQTVIGENFRWENFWGDYLKYLLIFPVVIALLICCGWLLKKADPLFDEYSSIRFKIHNFFRINGTKPKIQPVSEKEAVQPTGTPYSDAERDELIQFSESFIKAMGQYVDNPIADMVCERIDMLKNGATKEQIAELEERYKSIYGSEDNLKSNS